MAFTIKGAVKLRGLKAILDAQKFRVPLKMSQAVMIQSVDKNFRVEGRPKKWTPSMRAVEEDGMTLQDTGKLRASNAPGGTGNVTRIEDYKLEMGTQIPYAKYHQSPMGAPRKRGAGGRFVAERKFLLFQAEDKERIRAIFKQYIQSAMNFGGS